MNQQAQNSRYAAELIAALLLYALVLSIAVHLAGITSNASYRVAAALMPVAPIGVVIWVIVRHFRRIDEYLRRVTLENLSVAAGVTAALSLSYGFLESAGFPKLSMFVVWPVMGAVWALPAVVWDLLNR